MDSRDRLISILRSDGIPDGPVLDAIAAVPRERFVPRARESEAWGNFPVPIGHGQTISQPFTVAQMLLLSGISKGQRLLEVGAGSGYLAALATRIIGPEYPVFAIERIPELVARARRNLAISGYSSVHLVCSDGKDGLPEESPFDCIIVSAQSASVPSALLEQLAPGGRLVIPVSSGGLSEMTRLEKTATGTQRTVHGLYRFVPLL